MKSSVTNRQVIFMVFIVCVALTTVTISQDLALSAGRGAWLTLLITALLFGVVAVIIAKLGRMYEGKILVEYSRDIAGGFTSYVLGIFYILYFLLFEVAMCNNSSMIAQACFMNKTPQWALTLILIPVFAFIAYKGLVTAARLAEIFCVWFLIVAGIIYVTMLIEGDWRYLQPLFNASKIGNYISAIPSAFPSFLGVEILTVLPMGNKNIKAPRAAFLVIAGVFAFYILDVYGSYAMIGMNEIIFHSYPLIDAIRLVEYPAIEFLQRVDVSYMTFGFIRIFIAEGIVYMALVEVLCKMLPKTKRMVIVLVTGAVITVFCVISMGIQEASEAIKNILSLAGIAATFIIPLALFVIAKVKKHGKKSA